jgi:hypothetical protein
MEESTSSPLTPSNEYRSLHVGNGPKRGSNQGILAGIQPGERGCRTRARICVLCAVTSYVRLQYMCICTGSVHGAVTKSIVVYNTPCPSAISPPRRQRPK